VPSPDSLSASDGDGSVGSISDQGEVWAGQFGEFGVMDSSGDLEGYLGNEDWQGDWD
jgi:hypothetical protein